jgi:hypothetical protein
MNQGASLTRHRPPSFFEDDIEGYKYCDPTIFRAKVFSPVNYVASIRRKTNLARRRQRKDLPILKQQLKYLHRNCRKSATIRQHLNH